MQADLPGTIVAALSHPSRVIGRAGKLPWHLPLELRLFRSLTWGGVLVMGRRTWESIGKPLPGREIWIWSRTLELPPLLSASGDQAWEPLSQGPIRLFRTETQLLEALSGAMRPIFYVGGAQIFAWALPQVRSMCLTWVYGTFSGEVHFPEFSEGEWEAIAWEYFSDRCVPFIRVQYERK